MSTLKLKVTKNEIEKEIWIHNVYNFSSTFYSSTESDSILSTIKKWINEIETKHILLKNFNLHHSLWNESLKLIQYVMTNKLIDIVNEADMKLTISQETITWKIRNSQSTIDLIFMFNELINKIKHCKTRSKINQPFDYISIFTKLFLNIISVFITFRKAWKLINVEKMKEWKKKFAIKNSKTKQQIDDSIEKLQKYLTKIIDKTISWTKISSESKSF